MKNSYCQLLSGFVICLFLLAIGANLQPAKAQQGKESAYDQKLQHGIEAFYKTDWEQAGLIFEKLEDKNPEDARAYFFNSMIPFWDYYFGGQSQSAAKQFLKRSQKAITVSKKQLQHNPTDTTMVLMLSGLYGYRSLVAANEKEYQTAIESGTTGFQYTRQLLALDADDPKALIGKGMFYYMVGSVPSGLKWVTNMIGFSGDIKEGFNALKKAAQSESYVRNDARMILAYLYERENQPEKARKYLSQLADEYSKNIIFQYHLGRMQEKTGWAKQARQSYRHVLKLKGNELKKLKQKSRLRLDKM